MKIKLLHNPRCSKSREAFKYLNDKKISFEVINYLKDNLTVDDLKSLSKKLNLMPSQFIRTKESIYKEMDLKSKSEEQLYVAMSEHPKLIERPILVMSNSAVVGRPLENIKKIF